MGLIAVVLIVLAVVGVGVAASGLLSSDEPTEKPSVTKSSGVPTRSTAPSRSAAPTPSDAPQATPPTGVPDLPVPGRTATPTNPMPTVLPSNTDGGQIGQPIN